MSLTSTSPLPLKPDLYIAVLGAEGSGKTTYIAALLYSVMHANVTGGEQIRMQFLEAEADEQLRQSAHQVIPTIQAQADETSGDYIRRIWKAMYQERNQRYSGTITGQDIFVKVRSDHLPLLKTEQIICVRDIPGGWVKDTQRWDEGSRQIRDQLRASNALIIILDATALIADGGYNVEQDRLLEVLIKALDTYSHEQQRQTQQAALPVAVIFSKCDRLTPPELARLQDSVHALRKSLNLCFRPEMVAYFNGSAFGEDPAKVGPEQSLPVTQSPFFAQIFAGFYHLFAARRRTLLRRIRWGAMAAAASLVGITLLSVLYTNWQMQQQRKALIAQLQPQVPIADYLNHLIALENHLQTVQHCWSCIGQAKAAQAALADSAQQASQRLLAPFQQESLEQATQPVDYYAQLTAHAQLLHYLYQRQRLPDPNQALATALQQMQCKQQFQTLAQQQQTIAAVNENQARQWEKYLATCPQVAQEKARIHYQQVTDMNRAATFKNTLTGLQQIKGDCERRLQGLEELASRYQDDPYYKNQLDRLIREEQATCEQQQCQKIREQAPYLEADILEQQISQLLARYPQTQCGNELKALLGNRQQDALWEELRLIQAKQVNIESETVLNDAENAYKRYILRYQGQPPAAAAVAKAQQLLTQVAQQRKTWLLNQVSRCWAHFMNTGNDLNTCIQQGKAYLTRYPEAHPATAEIEKMLTFSQAISQRAGYPLRIIEGSFPRKLNPDTLFVTIEVNGAPLETCTTPAIASETPTWNHACSILWKSTDKITVSAWSKAAWGKDERLLKREMTGHLALLQLCGWVKTAQPEPVIWNESATEWVKIRPAQAEDCKHWLPPLPQWTMGQ